MRVLFVCNFNQHRSPTAARVLSHKYETRSAGLYSGDKLTAEHIAWADRIVVFTSPMIGEVLARFPIAEQKPILNFDISPYHYDDDDLEEVLARKADTMLGTPDA
jgi:predicted protein tyrosine phosphatase